MKIMKIIEIHLRFVKIMKIIEIYVGINKKKQYENLKNPTENFENK